MRPNWECLSLKLCLEKQNKVSDFSLNILEHKETLILKYSPWLLKYKFTRRVKKLAEHKFSLSL